MSRKSITQEYFILAMNEKGYMLAMRREESNAGIVAAGIMDLVINGVITLEKKKISVVRELPVEFLHLASLYTYLKEKTCSADKLMSDYMASTGSRIRQLITEIGESLLEDHAAAREEGGVFGNKIIYIPDKNYKDELIGIMRSAMTKDDEITSHDMALFCLLKETKNLNQYFSKQESDEMRAKWKEMKREPQYKQLADMINYVSDITAMIMACVVTSLN